MRKKGNGNCRKAGELGFLTRKRKKGDEEKGTARRLDLSCIGSDDIKSKCKALHLIMLSTRKFIQSLAPVQACLGAVFTGGDVRTVAALILAIPHAARSRPGAWLLRARCARSSLIGIGACTSSLFRTSRARSAWTIVAAGRALKLFSSSVVAGSRLGASLVGPTFGAALFRPSRGGPVHWGRALSEAAALLLHVLHGPVEHVVVLEPLAVEELLEQALQVRVVGTVLEPQRAAVLEVAAELRGVAFAQLLRGGAHLAVHDALVFLLLRVRLEPLPRKRASDEVHENVPKRLQVVAATLLDADVRVYRGITRSACQVLILAVWDVLVASRVAILLRQTEVDDVHNVLTFPQSDQKVVRFHIPVNKAFGVHVLEATQELVSNHEHRLQLETPSTIVEQIFKTRAQKVKNHNVVVALDAIPAHIRDSKSAVEDSEIFDSYNNWGCLVFTDSSLMATSSPVVMFVPR
eukprot:CAMPEP_0171616764 /NCGR_PEP_ID=MMETSP0990-20121206/13681_1 /TAXON_ID=483369 /ORGANISM="non described non described, Strain CCMP2098" /LENGTH=463 /DNA_ID=CAMNT_0012181111 /DNA_START=224 /DNA_END=1616 /DNA_ORIENTATION=+